jgi:hypothetical protein
MNTMNTMNTTFDPQTLADDLGQVRRMYARFFASFNPDRWDIPVKGGATEWTLHETVAHLCALNGAGLESIKHGLRGEPYTFVGLDSRYVFNDYNRRGIDEHLNLPMKAVCAELLGILDEAGAIARTLQQDQAELTLQMPIYNRPVKIFEALSIIMIHAGLFHTAQVAEPAGLPPLWAQLSPEIRHRTIGRVMRAFSLLYRHDIGGSLRASIVFRIDGPGGGEWYVDISPELVTSDESIVRSAGHARLLIHLRETGVFCKMLTGRLHLPGALVSGNMRLRGDLRLFVRMNSLFSVDARPHGHAVSSEDDSLSRAGERHRAAV